MQAQTQIESRWNIAPLKVWLNRAGLALGIAGVAFVIHKLIGYSDELAGYPFSTTDLVTLTCLCATYASANVLMALGWRNILTTSGQTVDLRWAVTTYAVSGLAKYVPGNVFQFASRHAMGLAAGYGNRALIKSTVWELVCLISVGAATTILLLPTLWPTFSYALTVPLFAIIAVGISLAVMLVGNARLLWSLLFYTLFLAVAGIIFAMMFLQISAINADPATVAYIATAYIVAWLLGLVTPGAPAGIGVREASLIAILGAMASPPIIALAVVLGRVITVSGDLVFFGVGQAMARTEGKPS